MVRKAQSGVSKRVENQQTVYILITQCLQNGFFLENDARLALPLKEALRLLVGSPQELEVTLEDPDDPRWFTAVSRLFEKDEKQSWREFLKMRYSELRGRIPKPIKEEEYEAQISIEKPASPSSAALTVAESAPLVSQLLPTYLQQSTRAADSNRRTLPEKLIQNGPLYQFLKVVIDDEGRTADLHVIHIRDWGEQLMPDSWAAQPLEGFDAYLQPWRSDTAAAEMAASDIGYQRGKVTFYDVRSASLFDFKPAADGESLLGRVLNRLINDEGRRVQAVVIGVHSDVKVKLLLSELRSRYTIDRLVVSDALTAAPTVERHVAGLKFAAEVLGVEVIHNLNDLAQVLTPQPVTAVIPHSLTAGLPAYETYQKQEGLAFYQDSGMVEVVELSKRRSARLYKTLLTAASFLTLAGSLFIGLALVASLLIVLDSDRATEAYVSAMVIIGGAGLLLLGIAFLGNPIRYLQTHLNQLAQLQMELETTSLINALMRHYFSRPEHLEPQDPHREKAALENLEHQIDLIMRASQQTSDRFARLSAQPKPRRQAEEE